MADITQELQQILAAVYGEDVRGSIHDAIDKINKVGEKTLDAGNDIEEGDPAGGYYDKSIYINTSNCDLLKCDGIIWMKVGTIKGEDGNGIVSFTKTSTAGLTDTYRLLYDDGTYDDVPIKNGKGISSIDKTSTAGLVDTYTITYNDSTTSTFYIHNGTNGNRWYRGTDISGKSVNPTKFTGSGIAYANENDFYLNTTEGAIYHCDTPGDANTALWAYDFTMSGGGGGGSSDYTDLTNKPKINNVELNGNKTTKDLGITEAAVMTEDEWEDVVSDPTELAKFSDGDPVIIEDDEDSIPSWMDGDDFKISNNMLALKKKIKTYTSTSTTILGGGNEDIQIGFGFTFESTPVIMAVFVSDDQSFSADNTKLSTVVTYKASNGCSVNIANYGTASITGHLEVVVIG